MGKENKGKNKWIEALKFSNLSTGMAIALLIAGFAEALFMLFIVALDVLPFKYLAIVIILFVILDLIVLLLANSRTRRQTKSIGALVLVVFMLNVLVMGDYYVYSTYDTLNKISEERDTYEYYYVIAAADSQYETVADIKGKEVYVTDIESKQLNEARERLITKADVSYIEKSSIVEAADAVYSAEDSSDSEATSDSETSSDTTVTTSSNENLVLLSKSQREVAIDNIKKFKKNTKIIYKMKVTKRSDDTSKRVDVTKDSFNVLISGLDSWGTIDEEGLSDVNMVMTVNPTSHEILLTSIPRDSYVTLHSYGAKDKLTHSAIYGQEETKQTIEDFLGIDINYTIRVNFSMFCDVIDAIGGITVYNDEDFYSSVKGWHYKQGWLKNKKGHYMLWFARERKSFTDGDMKRNENQQKVLEATLKKVTQSKVILTRYTSILDAVSDEMQTDLTDKDLKKLARMQLKDMPSWTIKKVNIVGTTGSASCYSMGGQNLSCVFPTEESVNEAMQAIHDVMYPAEIKEETTETTTQSNESE